MSQFHCQVQIESQALIGGGPHCAQQLMLTRLDTWFQNPSLTCMRASVVVLHNSGARLEALTANSAQVNPQTLQEKERERQRRAEEERQRLAAEAQARLHAELQEKMAKARAEEEAKKELEQRRKAQAVSRGHRSLTSCMLHYPSRRLYVLDTVPADLHLGS